MSLARYTSILFAGNLVAIGMFVTALLGGSGDSGDALRAAFCVPAMAAVITWNSYRLARDVEPDKRSGFRSYVGANWALGFIWAVIVICTTYVLVGEGLRQAGFSAVG